MGWPQMTVVAWVSIWATMRLTRGAGRMSPSMNVATEVLHWGPLLGALGLGGFFS